MRAVSRTEAFGAADFCEAALGAIYARFADELAETPVRARILDLAVVAEDHPGGRARGCAVVKVTHGLAAVSTQKQSWWQRALAYCRQLGKVVDLTRGAPGAHTGEEVAAHARGGTIFENISGIARKHARLAFA